MAMAFPQMSKVNTRKRKGCLSNVVTFTFFIDFYFLKKKISLLYPYLPHTTNLTIKPLSDPSTTSKKLSLQKKNQTP